MFRLFKNRPYEPVAVAAVAGAAASLHAAWIANLVLVRAGYAGPPHALYLFVGAVYAIILALTLAWCRGRGCADARERAMHALIVAVVAFLVMTCPFVYGFRA